MSEQGAARRAKPFAFRALARRCLGIAALGFALGLLAGANDEAQARRARHKARPAPSAQSLSAKTLAQRFAGAAATSAALSTASRKGRGAQPDAGASVAVSAELSADAETTKLVFELSAAVTANAFVLAEPDRVIIDLPEVNFQVDPARGHAAQGRGLITAFRFGQFAPGKSRIVIDLASPAEVRRVGAEPISPGGPARLIIELAPSDRARFDAAAALAARSESEAAEVRRKSRAPKLAASTRPVIVLDAGHGGIDTGARGVGGAVEKTIVFNFTRVLAQKLEATKRYRVVQTRDSDVFVPLADRLRMARDTHAALFVSLHADSISDSADVTGATVYTVSEKASDAEAARVAEKENGADLAAGVVGTEDAGDVADILFDLTRRETRAYGHVFARGLLGEWRGAARLNKNPERSAGFRVLKAPDVPSVLLELGYLSSEKDVKSLLSPQWQDKAAASVARAVDTFFAPRFSGLEETPAAGIDPMATGSITPAPARVDGFGQFGPGTILTAPAAAPAPQ